MLGWRGGNVLPYTANNNNKKKGQEYNGLTHRTGSIEPSEDAGEHLSLRFFGELLKIYCKEPMTGII